MDDFRVGSTQPYDARHNEQRPTDSNRRKARRPASGVPEDEVEVSQSTAGDSGAEDNLGVRDYYTPAVPADDPE